MEAEHFLAFPGRRISFLLYVRSDRNPAASTLTTNQMKKGKHYNSLEFKTLLVLYIVHLFPTEDKPRRVPAM